MMRKADIELFSDYACPWCYITTRRLHSAIQGLPADVSVQVLWRPLPLDAAVDTTAVDHEGARRFLTAIGRAEGVEFAFERINELPDTFDAHRLVWLATRDGQPAAVVAGLVDRIYRAHFSEGRDIGDRTTLAQLAGAAGLDPARTAAQLAGPEGTIEVRALQHRAGELGIDTPPFLLINNIVGVRGSRSIANLRAKIEGGSWLPIRENIMDNMLLDIWSNQEMSDALGEYIERTVRLSLDRFEHRLDRVHVRLEDVNGPRGGMDKQCRLQVSGRPSWRIHVEGAGVNFYDAVDAATARARRSVGQLLARLAEHRQQAAA